MVKPETFNTRVPTACGNCDVVDRLLIHHVRHRGTFRRLCTSCVLREHPQSFCPTCFQVYPPTPSVEDAVTCGKCYSLSHSRCVSTATGPIPNPYICPLCVSPNSPIFKPITAKEDPSLPEGFRQLDRESVTILLAAAKIAYASMSRAAVVAKEEADRRAKEAALARKRAKEALEHVAYLLMRENMRREAAPAAPGGAGGNLGYAGVGFNTAARINNGITGADVLSAVRNGISSPSVVAERVNPAGNANNIVDHPNQVLAALNAVELRETGKKLGGVSGKDNPAAMDEDAEKVAVDDIDDFIAETNDGSDDEMFVAELEAGCEEVLDVQDGMISNVASQMDCKENGNNRAGSSEYPVAEGVPRTSS
ncbi:uncharacterized protein LOC127262494 [Andrographis paniculata]|uniref:uncharacterized protein LOC127262494 n=1 Tax=Andrographis paniculata TaxID=175694 RepID=UPI0021E7AF53|nr:uncharacterized protein LOC127262494 [Andrographis paniculata]